MEITERIRVLRRKGFTDRQVAAVLDLDPSDVVGDSLVPGSAPEPEGGGGDPNYATGVVYDIYDVPGTTEFPVDEAVSLDDWLSGGEGVYGFNPEGETWPPIQGEAPDWVDITTGVLESGVYVVSAQVQSTVFPARILFDWSGGTGGWSSEATALSVPVGADAAQGVVLLTVAEAATPNALRVINKGADEEQLWNGFAKLRIVKLA